MSHSFSSSHTFLEVISLKIESGGPINFRYQFITAPVISANINITVAIANIGQSDELVAVELMPDFVQQTILNLPPQSIQVAQLSLDAGKGPAFQVWLSIRVTSDQLVPTATIVDDTGTHSYLPGDFASFDVTQPVPARLW
jgi:hypothetical protein